MTSFIVGIHMQITKKETFENLYVRFRRELRAQEIPMLYAES